MFPWEDNEATSTQTSIPFLSYLLSQFSVDRHCLLNSLNMDSSGTIPDARDMPRTTTSPNEKRRKKITQDRPETRSRSLCSRRTRCGYYSDRLTFQDRQDFSPQIPHLSSARGNIASLVTSGSSTGVLQNRGGESRARAVCDDSDLAH